MEKEKKKCLIVTSEQYVWQAYKHLLKDAELEFTLAKSIIEVSELLEKESYDFGILSNSMLCSTPNNDYGVNPFTAGSVYVSPYFEKKKDSIHACLYS